jgi:DNA-binding MarR family transcriptional regulator
MLFVHLRVQGVEWRSGAKDGSGRASMSRTLHRLERRGLVVRRNWISGGDRTTNVSLTVAGWEEVGRLTGEDLTDILAFYRASARADEKEPLP